MFAVVLAGSMTFSQLVSSGYCSEVASVLNDSVKQGFMKQRQVDRILRHCRKYENKSDG